MKQHEPHQGMSQVRHLGTKVGLLPKWEEMLQLWAEGKTC